MASLDGPALFNLFSTGQYSDFTIICRDREFKVHKMVICPKSDFFRAIAKGNFQEQDSVTLQESDPDILAKVLHYLYFANYNTDNEACTSVHHFELREADLFDGTCEYGWFRALKKKGNSEKDAVLAQLLTHFQVYKAADMLGVERLKRAATFRILETAQKASSAKVLANFLENIYSTLPETDTIPRSAMTHSCAVNYDRLCCHTEVSALMEKHKPALWTAAGVMARVHKVRMAEFSKEIVTKICRERLCSCEGCEGSGLIDLDIAISSGYTTISAECDRCENASHLTSMKHETEIGVATLRRHPSDECRDSVPGQMTPRTNEHNWKLHRENTAANQEKSEFGIIPLLSSRDKSFVSVLNLLIQWYHPSPSPFPHSIIMFRRIGMPIGLPLVTTLIDLVRHGILRRAEPGAHAHVAVLRDALVRFFGDSRPASLALVFDGFYGVPVCGGAGRLVAAWIAKRKMGGEREEWRGVLT